MGIETRPWDAAAHLDSDAAILAYLEAVFEEGDPALIAAAIDDVARARGVADGPKFTEATDIGAIIRAMKALGLELAPKAA